ncbi:TolC family protein [Caldovatus aquaticus]|uniref:TolC family protein n=1 Tax=Caldovatus aquaticus TaxID=2865671 RepID=A0ABS7EYW4_9PROT|nr:TolC family protein [Caldovatus aquaticus]
MTLDEAERLLVERNLALVAARRGVDAARAQRLVAASPPPPQVSVGNTAGQVSEFGGRFSGWRLVSPTNNITLGLSVVVERGGKRELRTRFADEQIGVAEAQVLETVRGQVFQLRQAFLNALLARANLDVALSNRASLDRTEALLRRQVQAGQIPEGDLVRFQASRPAFEAEAAAAAQNYAAAAAALAALLAEDAAAAPGVPPAVPVRAPRAGTLAPVAIVPRGRLDVSAEAGVTREQLAEAAERRPDVVMALRSAAAAAANRALAEAGRARDVTLNGSLTRSRLPQDLTGMATASDQLGLSVSIPIFTARIVEGNIGVAAAQQAQAEAQARAALLAARADVATAWAAWEQARALRALYDSGALRRAEEAYAIAERAYLAGGRSLIEVLDALRTRNATRVAANQARQAALLALATLEQASGVSGLMPRP